MPFIIFYLFLSLSTEATAQHPARGGDEQRLHEDLQEIRVLLPSHTHVTVKDVKECTITVASEHLRQHTHTHT